MASRTLQCYAHEPRTVECPVLQHTGVQIKTNWMLKFVWIPPLKHCQMTVFFRMELSCRTWQDHLFVHQNKKNQPSMFFFQSNCKSHEEHIWRLKIVFFAVAAYSHGLSTSGCGHAGFVRMHLLMMQWSLGNHSVKCSAASVHRRHCLGCNGELHHWDQLVAIT